MDRLTQEEARMTTTQTLAVVHGLLNNVKVVMDGESSRLQIQTSDQTIFCGGGEASTSAIRRTLGMFRLYTHESVFPGLMPVATASYHARGCERD
jgi:hypothetical protein